MLYNPPSGSTDANAPYVGKNIAAGTQGSKIPPGAAEYPQREIVAAIAAAGLAPTNGDLTQLLQAIRALSLKTVIGSGQVPLIVPSPTLYVRGDGNDATADGSANSAAKAFKSITAAVAYAQSKFYLGGGTLTIQLGSTGVYSAPGNLPSLGGIIKIQGDTNNQSAYTLAGTQVSLVGATAGANVQLSGLTLRIDGANSSAVAANTGGVVGLTNVTFASSVATSGAHMFAGVGGSINVGAGCIVVGFAGYLFQALTGNITIAASMILTGTPTFSIATAFASVLGTITVGNSAAVSGSATATRYGVQSNAVINTSGGGANFFPGTAAGIVSTGGQYI